MSRIINTSVNDSNILRINDIGWHIVAIYILVSGGAKILFMPVATSVVAAHSVIAEQYIPTILYIHAIISISVSIAILVPMLKHFNLYIKMSLVILVVISYAYMLTKIITKGWEGDCGCMPGIIESNTLALPFVRDTLIMALIALLIMNDKRL